MDRLKEAYAQDVNAWAMLMLNTLKNLPNTAEKITLLRQVDKVKDAHQVTSEDLPAFVGALAVLSSKAARLVRGEKAADGYSKESIMNLVHSELFRNRFERQPEHFVSIRDLLDIRRKESLSDTLIRLAKSGH